jgi:hypothetical protein
VHRPDLQLPTVHMFLLYSIKIRLWKHAPQYVSESQPCSYAGPLPPSAPLEKTDHSYVYPGSIHIYQYIRIKRDYYDGRGRLERHLYLSVYLYAILTFTNTSIGDARSYIKKDGSMQFVPKRLTKQQKVVSSGTLCACNRIDVFHNNTIYYRSEYKSA